MRANEYIARFLKTIDNLDIDGKKIPGLILSHAGFGKTSTVQLYCNYMNYNLITLIPSMFSSDDILGLQSVQNGKLERLTPSWFNKMKETLKNGKRTILFIDEITTCDPYIQGPLLDLIFNGNLGEEHLPENVFIVAAGNYSDDLNNVFKMSAPLVNRFVLLNLRQDDFDLTELLTDKFETLTKKENAEEVEEYLGLIPSKKHTYSYENFLRWVNDKGEISFGASNYIEDETLGLLGFTSIRSVTNSLKFACKYMETFNDNIWMRIVGDTLGMSNRRADKPMSLIISSFSNSFKYKTPISNEAKGNHKSYNNEINTNLIQVKKNIEKDGVTHSAIETLSNYIDNMDLNNISSDSLELLSSIISENILKNRDMRNLHNQLVEKLNDWC